MRVLLATAFDWAGTYRTVRMLARAGLTVEVCCDPSFLFAQSRHIARIHPAQARAVVATLEALLEHERFDWVIVADDAIFNALARLANPWWVRPWFPIAPGGRASAFLTSKVMFAEICCEIGVPVPDFIRVSTVDEAMAAATSYGFPAIGKTEHGFSGTAVRCLDDPHTVRAWFASIKGPAIVQRFVHGRYATTEMCYAKGRLLAYVTSLRRAYWPTPFSPSTSREIIDLPSIVPILEALGTYTAFDGLCGIDFIIDQDGRPLISELNPRPTPGYGVRPDVTDLFARAIRARLDGADGAFAAVTRDSGEMRHFPEALSYAASEASIDAWGGAIESLRRVPLDEPGLAWAFARRALRDGFAERRRRKANPKRGSGGS